MGLNMNNYCVIENNLVINTTVADDAFAQEQGWILCPEEVGIGWSYVNGQFVAPVIPTPIPEEIQAQNKAQATSLLSATDWTAIASVADPSLSNPYLTNQAEFLAYRSAVRAIGVNPPTTAPVFPKVPTATWQTVTTTSTTTTPAA